MKEKRKRKEKVCKKTGVKKNKSKNARKRFKKRRMVGRNEEWMKGNKGEEGSKEIILEDTFKCLSVPNAIVS
jgi:hypothetical protein